MQARFFANSSTSVHVNVDWGFGMVLANWIHRSPIWGGSRGGWGPEPLSKSAKMSPTRAYRETQKRGGVYWEKSIDFLILNKMLKKRGQRTVAPPLYVYGQLGWNLEALRTQPWWHLTKILDSSTPTSTSVYDLWMQLLTPCQNLSQHWRGPRMRYEQKNQAMNADLKT